jgi:exopolyphosphatase / guanosine-5'-triphosphate,3'-diphosphate pyrophosphatase
MANFPESIDRSSVPKGPGSVLGNSPNPSRERINERIVAAIDVGTNSIHMVVVQIQPDLPSFKIITAEKDTVRLGERCQETGNLTPAAINRAIATLRRCQELAHSYQAEAIIAAATSAVREAPNGREFIELVRQELGLSIDLIAGEEEARRIYLGVLSAVEFNQQPHAIIDIGGGSTEIILGDGGEPRYLSSTKIGAVRLSELFVQTDPISDNDYRRLKTYVRGMLEWPTDSVLSLIQPGETLQLIGTSGTIESLLTLHLSEKLGEPPSSLGGYELSLADLRQLTQRLRQMKYEQRAQMLGMSERRAEIIVSGAVILQEAMEMLGCKRLRACSRALREGMIVDWMLSHNLIEDRLRYQGSVRRRSVLSLAHKYHVNLDNGDRVGNFALILFDQIQAKLHHWGAAERELLWAGSMLHNCGHYVSHSSHHKHSYYLIRNGGLLGYTDAEIELVANLARYHRKSPPKKKHDQFRNLNQQQRLLIEQLSSLLRVGVALDRRQVGAITDIRCRYSPIRQELHLHLTPHQPEDDCELELWSLEYKKVDFEATFGVKLIPHLEPAVPK